MRLIWHWPLPGRLKNSGTARQVPGENGGKELLSTSVGSSEESPGCWGGGRYGGLDRPPVCQPGTAIEPGL